MLIRCLSQRWAECMGVRLYAQQTGGTNVYDTSIWRRTSSRGRRRVRVLPHVPQPLPRPDARVLRRRALQPRCTRRAAKTTGRITASARAATWTTAECGRARHRGYRTAKPVWTRFVSPPSPPPPWLLVFSMFIDGFGAMSRLALSAAECEGAAHEPAGRSRKVGFRTSMAPPRGSTRAGVVADRAATAVRVPMVRRPVGFFVQSHLVQQREEAVRVAPGPADAAVQRGRPPGNEHGQGRLPGAMQGNRQLHARHPLQRRRLPARRPRAARSSPTTIRRSLTRCGG